MNMPHASPAKKSLACLTAVLLWGALAILPQAARAEGKASIRLTVDGESIPAVLEDNAAARDFLAMLPLTLTMKDYNGTEKISHLPRRLSTHDAPDGFEPTAGTLALYAPWGNLAIFYQNFSWSPGLVFLGRITSGLEILASRPDDFTMTVERAE